MLEIVPPAEPPVELTPKQKELRDYFAWKNPCDEALRHVQENYGSCSIEKYYGPEKPLWENEKFDDKERQQVWVGTQIIERNKKRKTFSQAAITLALSHDRARYYDNMKCLYLGDSEHLGQFREISPQHNDTPFNDVHYNYDQGVLNAFTGNTIIHIRETLDPAATTRSQKFFIVAIDLIAMEEQRLYADDKPQIESLNNPAMDFSEIIPLTSQTLKDTEVDLRIDDSNPLNQYARELFENQAAELQSKLMKSAHDGWQYKSEGYAGYSKLRPIADLDEDRGLLWAMGQSLGHTVTDRGAILQPFSQQQIAS